MTRILKLFVVLVVLAAFVPGFSYAATALGGTTLSANINASQSCFIVAAVSGIPTTTANATGGTTTTIGQQGALYVDKELMYVNSVNSTSKQVCALRGMGGSLGSSHASGAVVIVGAPGQFMDYDPAGYCGTSSPPNFMSPFAYTPWINIRTGAQWLCSSVTNTWVPGFGNPGVSGVGLQPTAASAISSNAITPSGPLIHVTGTTILKTINLPATMQNGSVTLIFDGSGAGLTWDATGNINVAGTSTTAGSSVTFVYDRSISKWVPSRLA